jgi:hypothetical protein
MSHCQQQELEAVLGKKCSRFAEVVWWHAIIKAAAVASHQEQ